MIQQRIHELTGWPTASASQTVRLPQSLSNQMWRDLREFYSLVGVFEKFLKIKKAGY